MKDMPKLESPFVRIQQNNKFMITDEINPGYEWVFDDPDVLCVEKLDGTNVSIYMNGGELTKVNNRTNEIVVNALTTNRYLNGIRMCYSKGRCPMKNGQYFGELMGPKIQKNFLALEDPEWFPFEYLRSVAAYKSFHDYDKTFANLSKWFKNDLFSLMYRKLHGIVVQPEGAVFYQPSTGKMAKLRRDMFDWYKGDYYKKS